MSVKRTVEVLELDGGLPVNCRISRGQLIPSLSPVRIGGGIPEGGIFACHSESINRFFLCTETDAYASASGTELSLLSSLKGAAPFSFEDIHGGKARTVVVNGNSRLQHDGTSFIVHSMDTPVTCGIMHCGRLFGANGITVYWSDGESFKSGGSLTLDPERGEIINICRLGEKLVFVRKFGLTCANMFGSPENFSVDITDTDTDEIYKNTACIAGGVLLFYTASGLCGFDGSRIERISHRCGGQVGAPKQAIAFADIYYLNCYCKGLGRDAVLCYDPTDGESWFADVQADCICSADCVYAFSSSGAYRLEEGGEGAFYICGINFGTGAVKTVTNAFVDSDGCEFALSDGRRVRSFKDAGALRPRLRGREFSVAVKTAVSVRKITLTAVGCNEI